METNFLIRFFCFCSGASLQVLKECPIELNKYTSIGATVFFTGVLAAISGSYALYSIFYNSITAVFFGIFWGLLIFNLDRYIVSSLKKNGSKWKELTMALPRLLVAIVISMVIAKPLEVRIFKDRVERQIHENMLHKLVDDKIKINEIYEQDRLNKAIITKNNELAHIDEEINDMPQGGSFEKLYLEMQAAEAHFNKLASLNTSRIKQLQKQIGRIYATQPNRLFDARGKLIAESISPEAYRKIQACNREAYILKQKTASEEKKYLHIKNEVDTLIAQHRVQVSDRLLQAKKELTILNKEKAVADSLAYAQFTKGNQVNQKTYQANFITQLEALGTLTKDRFSTMWWASFFISFLFILVETSPIVVKLMALKGPYELILERYEAEVILYNKNKMNFIKGEINQRYFLEQLHKEATEQENSTAPIVSSKAIPLEKEVKKMPVPLIENKPARHEVAQKQSRHKVVNASAAQSNTHAVKPHLKVSLLEGITWKMTDARDALCYVFRNNRANQAKEFVLIANGDVNYGKWDYIDERKIWIELSGEKIIYDIKGLNALYLQLKRQHHHTAITFKRM